LLRSITARYDLRPMTDNFVTTGLAIWGAIVSAVLAALKIRDHFKDRAIIKVQLMPGMKAFPASSVYGKMTVLAVKLTNVGRRPTSITHVAVMLPRRHGDGHGYVLCADPSTATYPVELTEGKPHSFVFNQDALLKDYGLTPSQLVVRADEAAGGSTWSHGRLTRWWKLGRMS
jgi:hypothetical protein